MRDMAATLTPEGQGQQAERRRKAGVVGLNPIGTLRRAWSNPRARRLAVRVIPRRRHLPLFIHPGAGHSGDIHG